MKIITLVGGSNSGKTSSIKLLANEMLKMSEQIGEPQFLDNYKKNGQRSCIDQSKLKKCSGDLLLHNGDITIKFKWKGITIGITSFGDDVHAIKTKFELFKGCDMFLSAAHPDDETIEYIQSIANDNSHILIQKSTVQALKLSQGQRNKEIENFCNNATAKEMLDIIKYLL